MPDEQGFLPLFIALNLPDVATVALPLGVLLAAVLCLFVPVICWRRKLPRKGSPVCESCSGLDSKLFYFFTTNCYQDQIASVVQLCPIHYDCVVSAAVATLML